MEMDFSTGKVDRKSVVFSRPLQTAAKGTTRYARKHTAYRKIFCLGLFWEGFFFFFFGGGGGGLIIGVLRYLSSAQRK